MDYLKWFLGGKKKNIEKGEFTSAEKNGLLVAIFRGKIQLLLAYVLCLDDLLKYK